mmetsp:Transcript_20807/g.33980  ORF Transcript_20807/g.33980 Transcript_20807/m.33980 type:complete len:207 (+) Transcript_20807:2791-3411(+)
MSNCIERASTKISWKWRNVYTASAPNTPARSSMENSRFAVWSNNLKLSGSNVIFFVVGMPTFSKTSLVLGMLFGSNFSSFKNPLILRISVCASDCCVIMRECTIFLSLGRCFSNFLDCLDFLLPQGLETSWFFGSTASSLSIDASFTCCSICTRSSIRRKNFSAAFSNFGISTASVSPGRTSDATSFASNCTTWVSTATTFPGYDA